MKTANRPAFITDLNRFAAVVAFVHGYGEWELKRSLDAIQKAMEQANARIEQTTNTLVRSAIALHYDKYCGACKVQSGDNGCRVLTMLDALTQYENEPTPQLLDYLERTVEFIKLPYPAF